METYKNEIENNSEKIENKENEIHELLDSFVVPGSYKTEEFANGKTTTFSIKNEKGEIIEGSIDYRKIHLQDGYNNNEVGKGIIEAVDYHIPKVNELLGIPESEPLYTLYETEEVVDKSFLYEKMANDTRLMTLSIDSLKKAFLDAGFVQSK